MVREMKVEHITLEHFQRGDGSYTQTSKISKKLKVQMLSVGLGA